MYSIPALAISGVIFTCIILFYLTGVWVGRVQRKNNPDAKAEGVGPFEGALLGLLALLLSFTFNMSASRYDTRRGLLIQEANAISTVLSYTDLYPDSIRREFRKDLQQYFETRILYRSAGIDEVKIGVALRDARKISDQIWQRAARLSKENPIVSSYNLMLSAINDMISVVTSRDAARLARVPEPIIWLLIILTFLGSLIIGYSKKEKKNDWVVLSIYSLMTVITIFIIIDLDRPRRGVIKTSTAHQKIDNLRDLFKE
jgi:hypothetical protein